MPYTSKFPKICEFCTEPFEAKKPKVRFCSRKCATSARVSPESREKSRQSMNEIRNRPEVKEKLSAHLLGPTNPFRNPETAKKAQDCLKINGYRLFGGNGTGMTEPQELLFKALGDGWTPEHSIKTGNPPGYPPAYKVDLGNPEFKVAIEIHGNSHRGKAVQIKDEKKRLKLEELGWVVLTYWNLEVHSHLNEIAREVDVQVQIRSNRNTTN